MHECNLAFQLRLSNEPISSVTRLGLPSHSILRATAHLHSRHTVEELQEFSNIRVPSPITARNPRVLVPISCCDEAANHLISVLGGEERAKKIVGGTKWWQASFVTAYKPSMQLTKG